ncbi:hypothetical protein [Candidatus Tisiphia endosymbiont of Nedyus quadrimaculatus]|uniref:hypothetical protein n=1 Tax=Candidatus Tisiphia endosymbiont of Nedyus quadrimaculatus TaxID=3139332 RepID=UPI001DD6AFEF|nr:hypothetical protein [Rickettsia endosymbiont of Sericostoma sp.]
MAKNDSPSKSPNVIKTRTDTSDSTEQILSTIPKHHKSHLYTFIENLFKMDMSQDVLVDIVINDDLTNPCDNRTTIVGRPKVLGSATKQMRHVTPYSFIEAAIKAKIEITEKSHGYYSYIDSIVENIKPLIKSKKGICLTADQYSKLVSNITLQGKKSEIFKLSTTSNEYYLISHNKLIEQFKNCNDFPQDEKDKAETDFSTKFEKYITYGIEYLTGKILDSEDINTITIVCEGIARIILTLFNQDKYAAFPEEGNSMLGEIRIYKDKDAANKPLKQKYEVFSHQEITKEISTLPIKTAIARYDLHIRIVDNEGPTVKRVAKVLKIINSLVSSKIFDKENVEDIKYQKEYNEKYNFTVNDPNLTCRDKYNEDIDIKNNLMDIFQYHVAKHLYSVFDFKPLEKNILAPKQKGDTKTIKIYPSATGIKTAEYLVQSGQEYRDLQYNSRKGYNDDAIFRCKMTDEETINVLKDKVVNHVIISLLPFKALEVGCIFDKTQCKSTTILEAFCELVKAKYEAAGEIRLGNSWMDDVQCECSMYFADVLGESRVMEDNYNI